MKMKSNRCPYCGCNLGLMETLHIKENITYMCKNCYNVSIVDLSAKIKLLITLFVAIFLAIIAIFSLVFRSYFLGAVALILVALVFYAAVPLFIFLRKTDQTSRKN